jgi:thiol-disulfide isomerase/thioredoxin
MLFSDKERDIPLDSDTDIKRFNERKGKKGTAHLVWYFSNYCGHCHTMREDWEKLEQSKPKVVVLKIEQSQLNNLDFDPKVMGYPTIRLYKNGKEIEYSGDRTTDNIKNFIETHVTKTPKSLNNKKSKKSKSKISKKSKSKKSKSKSKKRNLKKK